MKLHLPKRLTYALLAAMAVMPAAYAVTLDDATLSVGAFDNATLTGLSDAGWTMSGITIPTEESGTTTFTSGSTQAQFSAPTGTSLDDGSGRHAWSAVVTVSISSLKNAILLQGGSGEATTSNGIGLGVTGNSSAAAITGTWQGDNPYQSLSSAFDPDFYDNGDGTVTLAVTYKGDDGTTVLIGNQTAANGGLRWGTAASKISLTNVSGIEYSNLYWFNQKMENADLKSVWSAVSGQNVDSFAWNGGVDAEWNTTDSVWSKGGVEESNYGSSALNSVVFGNGSELNKHVTITENVKAGSVSVQDNYTFAAEEGIRAQFGSLAVAAGKTVAFEGGSFSTQSFTADGAATLSIADDTEVDIKSVVNLGAGKNLTTQGEGELTIPTLQSSGGDIILGADTHITGGDNGQGRTNNRLGLAMISGGAQIRIDAGTTTVDGATYLGETTGALRIGTGSEQAKLVTGRLEAGDRNGGTSEITVGENGTLVVMSTNDVPGNGEAYKNTGLLLSEWQNVTTLNVAGKMFAKDVQLRGGDREVLLNINGGTLAVKGISPRNSNSTISLTNGGKLILGSGGIAGNETISATDSEVGMTDDTTIGVNMALTGTVNFNTSKYAWDANKELIATNDGTNGGTMTLAGTTGTGKMTIGGNGSLVLNGTLSHTGGTEVLSGATLSLNSASTLGGTITNAGTVAFTEGTALNIGDPANYTGNVTFIDTKGAETEQGNGFANIGSLTIIDGGTITGSATVHLNGQDLELSAATNGTVAVNDTDYTTYYLKSGSAVLSDITDYNESSANAHVNMQAGTTLTVDSGTMTGTMTVSADTVYTQPEAGIAGTYDKDVTIADLGGSGALSVTGGATMTLAGGGNGDINLAMNNGKLVVTADTTIGNITAPGNANGITVNEGAKLSATNIDPAWSLGDVTVNGELDVTNLKLHTGAVNKSFNGTGTLKAGSALFTNWTRYTFSVNTMEFGSMSVSNGSDITIGGGTATIEGALTVAGGSQLTVSGGTLNLGTSSTVNGTMSTTGGRVVTGEAGLTVANGGTLSINRISGNDGSQGAIQGSLTVQNGGTVKLAQGDVLGYSGGATSTQKLKVENGGTVKLMHANNETFTGALVLNGTITTEVANNADAVGMWDLFRGNASVSVDAREHGVFDKTTLRIRRDNATFTVGEDGSLTTGNIILGAGESNGHIIKAGSGDMIVGGTAAITGLQVTGGSIDFQTGTVALNALNVAADTAASFVSLTLNNNATLDIAGSVSLSNTLSLGTGITLGDSLTAALANLTTGNSLTLFSGATTFNVNGSAFVEGTTASTVFSGITSDNYLLSFADNIVSITLAGPDFSGDIIINSDTDEATVPAGEYTSLTGESGYTLSFEGETTITGDIAMEAGSTATIESGASIANKGVTIAGAEDGSTSLGGTESGASYTVTNGDVTVDTTAAAPVTLDAALTNSSLTNESSQELTVTGGDSTLTSITIAADTAINFTNVTTEVEVDSLTLNAGAAIGVFADAETLENTEKTLTVTGTMTVTGNAAMNANLVVEDGAALDLAGTVTMGCSVTLGQDLTLTLTTDVGYNPDTDLILLFDSAESVTLGVHVDVNNEWLAASEVFSSITIDSMLVNIDDYVVGVWEDRVFLATTQAAPEPATATLSLLALAGLAARRRRR